MKSKYKNVRTKGFASKGESKRYDDLCLLQRAGEITDLKTQVRYTFEKLRLPSGRHPAYVADFTYKTREGVFTVEDFKGFSTRAYKMNFALMKYFFDIEILET